MVIFLKNLPADVKKFELVNFLNQAFTACRLSTPQVAIRDIEILTASDGDATASEKYAVVKVFPKESGKQILRWINGKSFKQQSLKAREFVCRSKGNDHRKNVASLSTEFAERRNFERRCKSLMIAGTNRPLPLSA